MESLQHVWQRHACYSFVCERQWQKGGVWIGTDRHISNFISSEWHLQNVQQNIQIYFIFTMTESERHRRITPFGRLEPDNVWLLLWLNVWSVISMVAIHYPTRRSSFDTDTFDLVRTRLTYLLFGLLVFLGLSLLSFYRQQFFLVTFNMWSKSKQSDLLTHLNIRKPPWPNLACVHAHVFSLFSL